MTSRLKHPKSKADRLRIKQRKHSFDKKVKDKAGHIRKHLAREDVKIKETEDELREFT